MPPASHRSATTPHAACATTFRSEVHAWAEAPAAGLAHRDLDPIRCHRRHWSRRQTWLESGAEVCRGSLVMILLESPFRVFAEFLWRQLALFPAAQKRLPRPRVDPSKGGAFFGVGAQKRQLQKFAERRNATAVAWAVVPRRRASGRRSRQVPPQAWVL